jgi:AcrR family transcriptional regulator
MGDPVEDALPRAVALSWGIAEHPQRGPKRELSIERIVDAAIELADAEGLQAVSMGRVAASLGFTTMSLYRYLTSKDDLLLLMRESVSGIPIPPEGSDPDWREGLRLWIAAMMDMFRQHPWYGDIPISGVPMMPNDLAYIDWALRIMRDMPLTGSEKMSVILLLSSYSLAVGRVEHDLSLAGHATPDAVPSPDSVGAALAELVSDERFPYLGPFIRSGAYTGAASPEDDLDDFAFGLERILDGVEHYVGVRAEGSPPEPVVAAEAPYPRDRAVREAVKARREVEAKLRDALKREREAIAKARERAEHEAAVAAKRG